MSSGLLITLEVIGVLGVLIALAGWELYTLRRDRERDRSGKQSGEKRVRPRD